VLLRVGVSLPVWSGSYAAAERESRHLARALREELDAEEQRLRVEVETSAFHIADAGRRIALYRDSLLPRAEEALQLTLASYRAGEASVLDVIDSERALLEFERSYWRACRDYGRGRAELRALTGEAL
jgi:outer membrane protein TolC